MLAQSGRFRGLDFSISSFSCCDSLSGGRSFKICLPGGGGGGRGGGGGGIAALEELFDRVGAPVVLSLLERGIVSPRDRDFSIRTCRSSCGLEFGSCRPFSRSFDAGLLVAFFSLFGCDGIIVILLCLRGCVSAAGFASGFGTFLSVTCANGGGSSAFVFESLLELRVQGAVGMGRGFGPSLTQGGLKVVLCGG